MNIDEVLLTRDELQDAFDAGYKGETGGKRCQNAEIAQNKAQCLKLLEWLKETCKEHPRYDEEVGGSTYKYFMKCKYCPDCMSELESKLKEG